MSIALANRGYSHAKTTGPFEAAITPQSRRAIVSTFGVFGSHRIGNFDNHAAR
jgi:hypothetical protein